MKKDLGKLLTGNWANDHIGRSEELEADVEAMKKTIVDLLEILIDKQVISYEEIIEKFQNGWQAEGMFDDE